MGQRDIRRLLIIGASAVVTWAARKGPRPDSWLALMIWAITTRETLYKDLVVA